MFHVFRGSSYYYKILVGFCLGAADITMRSMNMNDEQLVRDFCEQGSEPAFATLVQRHRDSVYAAALRRLGDAAQAEEVTQNVFLALAHRAPDLRANHNLTGWLCKATGLEAIRRYRDEQRHKRREARAVEMGTTVPDGGAAFDSLLADLDEALLHLRESDRRALLLRFFERKNFRQIGEALGIGEDAAQKRVRRCLEDLSLWFRRRGYGVAKGSSAFPVSSHAVVAGGGWRTREVTVRPKSRAFAFLSVVWLPVSIFASSPFWDGWPAQLAVTDILCVLLLVVQVALVSAAVVLFLTEKPRRVTEHLPAPPTDNRTIE